MDLCWQSDGLLFNMLSRFVIGFLPRSRHLLISCLQFLGGSDSSLSAVQETSVSSLGREDPLEKGMATHSSILSWTIPWTEELGGLQSMGLQIVRHD